MFSRRDSGTARKVGSLPCGISFASKSESENSGCSVWAVLTPQERSAPVFGSVSFATERQSPRDTFLKPFTICHGAPCGRGPNSQVWFSPPSKSTLDLYGVLSHTQCKWTSNHFPFRQRFVKDLREFLRCSGSRILGNSCAQTGYVISLHQDATTPTKALRKHLQVLSILNLYSKEFEICSLVGQSFRCACDLGRKSASCSVK